jgi:hypothetical protein
MERVGGKSQSLNSCNFGNTTYLPYIQGVTYRIAKVLRRKSQPLLNSWKSLSKIY